MSRGQEDWWETGAETVPLPASSRNYESIKKIKSSAGHITDWRVSHPPQDGHPDQQDAHDIAFVSEYAVVCPVRKECGQHSGTVQRRDWQQVEDGQTGIDVGCIGQEAQSQLPVFRVFPGDREIVQEHPDEQQKQCCHQQIGQRPGQGRQCEILFAAAEIPDVYGDGFCVAYAG